MTNKPQINQNPQQSQNHSHLELTSSIVTLTKYEHKPLREKEGTPDPVRAENGRVKISEAKRRWIRDGHEGFGG